MWEYVICRRKLQRAIDLLKIYSFIETCSFIETLLNSFTEGVWNACQVECVASERNVNICC